jgi:hypothetical protein
MVTDSGWLAKRKTLFDAIQHGDEEHRAWLKVAIGDGGRVGCRSFPTVRLGVGVASRQSTSAPPY